VRAWVRGVYFLDRPVLLRADGFDRWERDTTRMPNAGALMALLARPPESVSAADLDDGRPAAGSRSSGT